MGVRPLGFGSFGAHRGLSGLRMQAIDGIFNLNTRFSGRETREPSPPGSRLRARMKLLACDPIDNRGMQMTWEVTTEREGLSKPVCVAESIARHYP